MATGLDICLAKTCMFGKQQKPPALFCLPKGIMTIGHKCCSKRRASFQPGSCMSSVCRLSTQLLNKIMENSISTAKEE